MTPADRTSPASLPRRGATGSGAPGTRWRRPSWKDPRLAGGLALIGAAVALGAWAVDAAAETMEIYVLSQDVPPGTELGAEGVLTTVSAHPGTEAYIEVGHLPEGAVATRSLSQGELLPLGAVGTQEDLDLRPVVLDVSASLPSGTGPGDVVDLWILPDASGVTGQAGQDGQDSQAQEVAAGLVVVDVGEPAVSLAASPGASVEVGVPESLLSVVLTSAGQGRPLALVPTGQEPVR